MDKAYELEKKYSEIVFKTSAKLYFEAALSEINDCFDNGEITQREWAKLYQVICALPEE